MLELALRASLILGMAWMLSHLLARAAAATRHLVWHVALIASLLAPLAAVVPLPRVAVVPHVLDVASTSPSHLRSDGGDSTRTSVASTIVHGRTTGGGTVDAVAFLGTALVALWFAAGWIATARLAGSARPAPLAWQLELERLCHRVRHDRPVRLGLIDRPGSPLATGAFCDAILLPRTAAAWSDDRRRAVLLHELAHIRRRDCRVQMVVQVACALYWFNPLVWKAAARLRSERERACDDEVLRLGTPASSYAQHLLDLARQLQPARRPSAALAMARPSELEGRLLAVLAVGRARVPARGTRWLVVSALSVVTAIAFSATSIARTDIADPRPPIAAGPVYTVADDVIRSADTAPEPLAKAEATLRSSHDPQARERATLALALTSGRDVIPALLRALADTDSQVREQAAIGLALRRDARVIDPLLTAMNDPDSQVREKVAIALGTSADPRAADALTRALADPDAQVREKAVAALILLGKTR